MWGVVASVVAFYLTLESYWRPFLVTSETRTRGSWWFYVHATSSLSWRAGRLAWVRDIDGTPQGTGASPSSAPPAHR